ncbi:MAG: putative repeat protein (TIGR01451 family), partial [Myxococcota bacterium]
DGDDALAAAGDRLRYTLEYGNAGHFVASDVVLEDALPEGTVFVIGSIANLFSDAVDIDYDDGSLRWDYQPTGVEGTTDSAVTAFRVRWKDPLRAPANDVFSQDSAESFAASTFSGVTATVEVGGVAPTVGQIDTSFKCAEEAEEQREGDDGGERCGEYQSSIYPGMCNSRYRLDSEPGDCCAGCADEELLNEDPSTCNAPACPEPSGVSFCADPDEVIDFGTDACIATLDTAYDAWAACLTDNGDDASLCTDLEMTDAWDACGLARECADLEDNKCAWKTYHQSLAMLSSHIRGKHSECNGTGVDASRCSGWIPWLGWGHCNDRFAVATCPGADADSLPWLFYMAACRDFQGALGQTYPLCVSTYGEAACAGLVGEDPCGPCLADEAPKVPEQAECVVEAFASGCKSHVATQWWSFCTIVNPDNVAACAWLAPSGGCLDGMVANCGTENLDCTNGKTVNELAFIEFGADNSWNTCRFYNDGDPGCDAVLGSMRINECIADACPAEGGRNGISEGLGAALLQATGIAAQKQNNCTYWATNMYSEPLTAEIVAFCDSAVPLPDIPGCFEAPPSYDNFSAFESWWDACTEASKAGPINNSSGLHFCVRQTPDDLVAAHCGRWLEPDHCRQGLVKAAQALTDPVQRDALAFRCQHPANGQTDHYTACVKTFADKEYDEGDVRLSFPEIDAFCQPARMQAELGCKEALSPCIAEDETQMRIQLALCGWTKGAGIKDHEDQCAKTLAAVLAGFDDVPEGTIEAVCNDFEHGVRDICLERPVCGDTVAAAGVSTPSIPADATAVVLEWDKLVVETDETQGPITFTVSDADTGLPIPGLVGVTADDNGVIDLSGVSPGDVGRLQVRADFGDAVADACFRYPPVTKNADARMVSEAGMAVFFDPNLAPPAYHWVWDPRDESLLPLPEEQGDPPPPPGLPLVVNDAAGIVAGFDGGQRPQFWRREGDAYVQIPFDGEYGGWPWAVNDQGWGAGPRSRDSGPAAFVPIDAAKSMYTMIELEVEQGSWATDINNNGWITGYATAPPLGPYTFVARPDDALPPNFTVELLPPIAGFQPDFYPIGWSYITDDNVVLTVGTSPVPVVWWLNPETDTWEGTDLAEMLPPGVEPSNQSFRTVNKAGEPYGWYRLDGRYYIARFRRDGGLNYTLEVLPGSTQYEPKVLTMAADRTMYFHRDGNGSWGWAPSPYIWRPDGTLQSAGSNKWWGGFFQATPYSQGASSFNGATVGYETGNRRFVWNNCASAAGPVLDSWTVLYTTDQNPSFTVDVQVADVCQTSVTNTAQISTGTPEITTANNQSSASIAVETADMDVAVVSDVGAVELGNTVTFTVAWQNLGPGVARAATLSYTPPGEDTIVVPLGDLAPGESGEETIVVTPDSEQYSAGDVLAVAASANSRTIDCAGLNDTATGTVAVGGFPNLTVTIDGPPSAAPNAPVTYTVTYGNNGTDEIDQVVVTAQQPPGTQFVSASNGALPSDSGLLTWTIPGTLTPGDSGTLTFTVVTPGCDAVDDATTALAEIRSDAPEVFEVSITDNTDSAMTALTGYPGLLELAVAPDQSMASSGDVVTWRVYFRNSGAGTVRDATIDALIPPGHTPVLSTLIGGAVFGSNVRWAVPALAAGDQGSFSFSTVATLSGAVAVEGGGSGACPTAADGAGVNLAPAGLRIVKTADSNQVCDGGDITWSMVVTNLGDTPLVGVVVTDTVLANTSYVADSVTGAGADDGAAPVMVWNVGTLGAGDARTLTYTTTAPSAHGAVVANAAIATAGETEVPSNPAAVHIDCQGSLALSKAWDGGCMQVGDEVTVVLTARNRGGQSLSDVVLTDWIPAGFELSSAGSGTWNAPNRLVSFDVGGLAPGAVVEHAFVLTLSAGAAGTLRLDTAMATAANAQSQASNAVAGAVLNCSDGDFCTVDTCTPVGGCVNTHTLIDVADDQCDDVDDDCDGTPDDDYMTVATSCGVGECGATGSTTCVGGEVIDDC